ncbi:MAG: DUF5011 domain-containing protein, partial [Thermoguttaceae bacterium]|nr:DUF5011 domain-containing protein [Thermoguttaceae bacterium]
ANATLEAVPADTTPPVITLTGDASCSITVGDTWTDPGATATDNVDQSVTVTTDGTVDTSTPGTYLITYLATDTAGNEAIPVTREVTVVAADSGSGSEGSGSGSGSDTGSETGSGSGTESGSGSGSDTGSGSDSGSPSGIITYTTPAGAIEPNQRVWLRAVLTDGDTRTSTNADSAYLTQPTVLRAIYDNNVLCLWRSGMTLSSSSDNCFRARLETGSGSAARVLRPTEITSIVYSIRRLGYQASQSGTAVTGHTSIVITTCPWVLQNPITDTNWNVDTIGYNFMHWPDSSEYFPFSTPGFYEVEYIFTTTNGQRLMLVFKVNVS